MFAVASEEAYGAVAYLRIEDKNGQVQCSFVIGKSHLAPNPRITIPRLELLAAVTAVRLYQSLKEQLPASVAVVRFWTDSTAVLQSIRNSLPVLEANTLAKIKKQAHT